jgi:hypothetical protein
MYNNKDKPDIAYVIKLGLICIALWAYVGFKCLQ